MNAPRMVTTPRLTGRRVQQDDLAYVIETDSDIRIQQWLFGEVQTQEQSRARHARWLHMWDEAGLGFWIFSDASGADVGHGGLFPSPREQGEVEVGYVIKPGYWGRGFATEIAKVSLDVGLRLGIQRIIGIAQAANLASRRVMENCGMILECELPSPDGITGVRYAAQQGRP